MWNEVSGGKGLIGHVGKPDGDMEVCRSSERKFGREGEGEELRPRGVEAVVRSGCVAMEGVRE